MDRFMFAVVISCMLAWSQGRGVKAHPPHSSLPVPRWEKGSIEGNTYKNASVGLEFTPAPGLKFETPELKGTPGSVPLLVTIGAWRERNYLQFTINDGTVFYTDALAFYPSDQRSTEAYMGKIIRANRQGGFEVVETGREAKLGGVLFARTDFKKQRTFEAILVKSCEIQVLVFTFASSDRDTVNKLIEETRLKLDSATSSCDFK